jgi:hypothetical protein
MLSLVIAENEDAHEQRGDERGEVGRPLIRSIHGEEERYGVASRSEWTRKGGVTRLSSKLCVWGWGRGRYRERRKVRLKNRIPYNMCAHT